MDNQVKNLSLQFFYQFSRLEFALKANGYIKTIGHIKRVEPDWDRFVYNIKADFKASNFQIKDSLQYYFNNPPKVLIQKDNTLSWHQFPRDAARTVENIFIFIRRIKDNLFCGDITEGRQFAAPCNDIMLLEHGIAIMDYVAEIYPKLKNTSPQE